MTVNRSVKLLNSVIMIFCSAGKVREIFVVSKVISYLYCRCHRKKCSSRFKV